MIDKYMEYDDYLFDERVQEKPEQTILKINHNSLIKLSIMKLFKALLIFWLSATAAAASAQRAEDSLAITDGPWKVLIDEEGVLCKKLQTRVFDTLQRISVVEVDPEPLLSASGTGHPDRENLSDGRQEQRGRRDQRRILQNENYPGRSRRPD